MKEDDTPYVFDCYVRLHEAALQCMPLQHLQSGLDSNDERENTARAFGAASVPSAICGYTEWISDSTPAVSVGWDWSVTAPGELTLNRHSIRTNVMLVDEHGTDRGREATIEATIRIIDQRPWQQAVLAAVQAPPRDVP
jgi:hypothetical protein